METVPDTAPAETRRWRPRLRRAGPLAAALAGVTVLAAACGSGPAASGSSGQRSSQKSAVAFATCMRSHGVPGFADPNTQGGHSPSNFDQNSPQFQAALKACRKLLPAGGQLTTGNGALSPRQQAQLLKYARCMRSHGITNFPDPTSKGLSLGDGVNPSSPQFEAAGRACQSLLPNRGKGTQQTSGGAGSARLGGGS